ncbi:family 20 glycosylhydrolase [Granulicella cerasi]|uniref:beta-N-acetylhexosaminidase n=1 Tax=Granulicella cerasi TaxID=741063 RepID=A0ABW1Z6V7_9BACT|nr:family 20 glycosylhydrolase [Granulicella cerasi]
MKSLRECLRPAVLVAGAALATMCCSTPVEAQAAVPLVPLPQHVEVAAGSLTLASGSRISFPAQDAEAEFVARHFAALVRQGTGVALVAESKSAKGARVELLRDTSVTGEEAYQLEVSPERAVVRASTDAGLYYGSITLWQWLSGNAKGQKELHVAAVKIEDTPAMRWRGLMIDSARHMQSIEFLHQLVDWMSLEKLNTLHWHLTDDQAWRLEIKRYPKLTSVGAWRTLPSQEGKIDPKTGKPYPLYGGFYTQDQVRELVAYAAKRNVMIVPEIEMPGHATAPIAAYPEFGSTATPPKAAANHFGILPNLYGPQPATFTFLQNVLTEVMALFPSPYIHVGGDEAIKKQWKASPQIQEQMKSLGITSEDQLQSYFIKQVDTFLSSHGRRTLGWDEILEGGLAPNAAVMSWHGVKGGMDAAKQGHDAVLTPARPLYFNYRQTDSPDDGPGRFAINSLSDVYKFDATPATLTPEERKHILGVQANIWTEYLITDHQVAWMIFPRAAALAEIGWTAASQRDWNGFTARLAAEVTRYERLDIPFNTETLKPVNTLTLTSPSSVKVALATVNNAGTMHYTIDGSAVTASSPEYKQPVEVKIPAQLHAASFVAGTMFPTSEVSEALTIESARSLKTSQLKQCVTDPVIGMEPDPVVTGRPVSLSNYRNPCWIEKAALLDGVRSITLQMLALPWVFEEGHGKPPVLPAVKTANGEIEVHLDSCKGALVATIPLPVKPEERGLIALHGELSAVTGTHDLCVQVLRPKLDPLWTLHSLQLSEK